MIEIRKLKEIMIEKKKRFIDKKDKSKNSQETMYITSMIFGIDESLIEIDKILNKEK